MTETLYKKEEKEILGTVANVRYYHQAAAWDSPLSFGVQAFIEYNGLVMNDRYQSDLIRVTSITGLDDAEIRDNREARPGKSGEFPYLALYGGRNIVISGNIEAGSLPALGTLENNLKAAFAPLEESQLKFRWFDVYDTFNDPDTILEYNSNANLAGIPSGNYSPLIGNLSSLKIENNLLKWTIASKVYFFRTAEKRTFCDSQMTMRCITGSVTDSSYIGFMPCIKDSENYLLLAYYNNGGNPKLSIESVNNGVSTVLESETIFSFLKTILGQPFWIRAKKEGNILTFEFWTNSPYEFGLPTFSVSTVLSGEDEEKYGDEILSEVGIAGEQKNTSWSFEQFKIESTYPGDIEFMARKISPISIKSEQTSLTKFKRPFQISMRTSDYRAFSSTEIVKIIEPENIVSSPSLGRSYPRSYPLSYRSFTSSTLPLQSNILSINNRGRAYVEPIMYLYNQGEDILIENITNGQRFEWLGRVNEEDYIIIDCKEETIVNSTNINYIEPLVSTTEWIKLEPGWNDIYIQGSIFTDLTKFVVKLRYGYM